MAKPDGKKKSRLANLSDTELKIIKDGIYVLFVENLWSRTNPEIQRLEKEVDKERALRAGVKNG